MSKETMSPAEAAKRIGVNISTVRRWISSGKLPTNKTPEGWHTIEKEHLLACAAANMKASQVVHTAPVQIPHQDNTHKLLTESLERERKRADRLEERNEQLQQDLMRMTKEMQALLNKESGLMGWIRSKKV